MFCDVYQFLVFRSDFYIESEADNYRLHIGGYGGTAGDSFAEHPLDGMAFTTPDRDNDW